MSQPGRGSHLISALIQDLVILVQRHQENDRSHVFKTVDPFPPLCTLTPYINHPVTTTPGVQTDQIHHKILNLCLCGFSFLAFFSLTGIQQS